MCSAKIQSGIMQPLSQAIFVMQSSKDRRRVDAVIGGKLVPMDAGGLASMAANIQNLVASFTEDCAVDIRAWLLYHNPQNSTGAS